MQRLIRGAAALVFGSGAGAVLSFVLALILGRGWGKEGLGLYTAALAWITPLSLLTEAGVGTLLTRDLARQPDSTAATMHAAIRQRLLMGGMIALGLCLVAGIQQTACRTPAQTCSPAAIAPGLILSAPLIVILPLYATFTALLRVQGRMAWIATLNISMLTTQVILTALLWQRHLSLDSVLIVNTLTSAGQCAAAAWITRRTWAASLPATPRIHIVQLLRRGLPFAAAAVIAAFQMRLIVIVLEQVVSAADVGLYAAAFKGVEIVRLLALAVFDALFPALAALAADRVKMQRLFAQMCLTLTLGAVTASVLLTALAPVLIPLLYGRDFEAAVGLLQRVAWGVPLLILRQSRILYGYALGAEQRVNRLMLIGLVGQALAAAILIPGQGAAGAAAAFVAGEAWGALVLWSVRF